MTLLDIEAMVFFLRILEEYFMRQYVGLYMERLYDKHIALDEGPMKIA